MSLETVEPGSELEIQFDTIQQALRNLKQQYRHSMPIAGLGKTAKKKIKSKKKEPKNAATKNTGFDIHEKNKA